MSNKQIISRFVSPDFAIFAIHGGRIEPGTEEIVSAIAGDGLSFYSFSGDSHAEHVDSTSYFEPKALELASRVKTIISIHGERELDRAFVMIGGLDSELADSIKKELIEAGFSVEEPPEDLDGDSPDNICNKGTSGKGVQLEISKKLRRDLWSNNQLLGRFVAAVRQAIFSNHQLNSEF